METLAQRNAMLVHGLDWNERRAGIFEPAPTDDLAVATTLGLVLNCLSSGLYMVLTCTHAVHSLLPAMLRSCCRPGQNQLTLQAAVCDFHNRQDKLHLVFKVMLVRDTLARSDSCH